ncbi:MAG TPA: hypothetical protein VNG89_11825, partial [Vicinamibacterales bacterium]|nr:hypothetical protein [Vicinamibacterales bacterium]
KSRNGRPFVEPSADAEAMAAIGAALEAALSASATAGRGEAPKANGHAASGWRTQARAEGVRGL